MAALPGTPAYPQARISLFYCGGLNSYVRPQSHHYPYLSNLTRRHGDTEKKERRKTIHYKLF
jgi:hypothetical protein